MGLGRAYKEETSSMKNVPTEISGRKIIYLWVEENCVITEKSI
jgi:hypothetical protein